jgi:hypothetical protein
VTDPLIREKRELGVKSSAGAMVTINYMRSTEEDVE